MILSKGRLPTNIHFKHGDKHFEIVKYFLYLGINLAGQGHLVMLKKNWWTWELKICNNNLSIQCQLELFDSMVKPIILYGCETWRFENN
jgi:hypothetical protein